MPNSFTSTTASFTKQKETTVGVFKRSFEGGAVRDTSEGKFDYFGFRHPVLEHSYAKYMHNHRKLNDGSMRDANNWWNGFGKDVVIQSLNRHMQDLNAIHAGFIVAEIRHTTGVYKEYLTAKKLKEEYNIDEGDKYPPNWKLITEEECCNAITFNADAFKLESLGLIKK